MLYYTHKLLNKETVDELAKRLISSDDWVDGKISNMVSKVKRNLQLDSGSKQYEQLSKEIINYVENDTIIKNSVFPSKIHNILFSRTGAGMFYGRHLDTPYLSTGRRDLSFTIFLNQKEDYKGGELILYIPPEKKQIKLSPGEMIMYPTKYLHEVKEVTEGERMVCVGWIESQIPGHEDRESLHLMKSAILDLTRQYGGTQATQSLSISFNNIFKRLMN